MYIETGGTGGSAFRKMYAGFLKEAADLLRAPLLEEASVQCLKSAGTWSAVADSALPESLPFLGKIKRLILASESEFLNNGPGSMDETNRLNRLISGAMEEAAEELADKERTEELLENLEQKILDCHREETRLFEILGRFAGAE